MKEQKKIIEELLTFNKAKQYDIKRLETQLGEEKKAMGVRMRSIKSRLKSEGRV